MQHRLNLQRMHVARCLADLDTVLKDEETVGATISKSSSPKRPAPMYLAFHQFDGRPLQPARDWYPDDDRLWQHLVSMCFRYGTYRATDGNPSTIMKASGSKQLLSIDEMTSNRSSISGNNRITSYDKLGFVKNWVRGAANMQAVGHHLPQCVLALSAGCWNAREHVQSDTCKPAGTASGPGAGSG